MITGSLSLDSSLAITVYLTDMHAGTMVFGSDLSNLIHNKVKLTCVAIYVVGFFCSLLCHRAIVKCRREHEYRLVRRPTRKEDFLAAIKYELRLDLLRKKRKKV